jgi:hypothetical protein
LALRLLARGEPQVDVRPGYSPETLYRLRQLYGSQGIRMFRRMLMADMIFPAVYGTLLFLLGDLAAAAHPAVAPACPRRVWDGHCRHRLRLPEIGA